MAYSIDLRTRAVSYFLNHNKQYREVAALFDVGVATLHDWVQRHEETGNVHPRKATGRPRLLSPAQNDAFKTFILKNADRTLAELSAEWHCQDGELMSISCVSRSIKRLDFSYKKNLSSQRERQ